MKTLKRSTLFLLALLPMAAAAHASNIAGQAIIDMHHAASPSEDARFFGDPGYMCGFSKDNEQFWYYTCSFFFDRGGTCIPDDPASECGLHMTVMRHRTLKVDPTHRETQYIDTDIGPNAYTPWKAAAPLVHQCVPRFGFPGLFCW